MNERLKGRGTVMARCTVRLMILMLLLAVVCRLRIFPCRLRCRNGHRSR